MTQLKIVFTLFFLFAVTASNFILAQPSSDELTAYNEPPSRLRGVIEKYNQDDGSINRFYTAETSANRAARLRELYAEHLSLLGRLDFDALNHDEQIDYLLFETRSRAEGARPQCEAARRNGFDDPLFKDDQRS